MTVSNELITYINMAVQGYLNAESLRKAKQLGIYLNNHKLPINEEHKIKPWFRIQFPAFIYNGIIVPCKKALQKWTG